MIGARAAIPNTTPSRFTARTCRYRSVVTSRNACGSRLVNVPAFRTANSIGASAASRPVANSFQAAASLTSRWRYVAPWATATASPALSTTSQHTTVRPSRASRPTVAAPIPDAAPVTTATDALAAVTYDRSRGSSSTMTRIAGA